MQRDQPSVDQRPSETASLRSYIEMLFPYSPFDDRHLAYARTLEAISYAGAVISRYANTRVLIDDSVYDLRASVNSLPPV